MRSDGSMEPLRSGEGSLRDEVPQAGFRAAALKRNMDAKKTLHDRRVFFICLRKSVIQREAMLFAFDVALERFEGFVAQVVLDLAGVTHGGLLRYAIGHEQAG